MRTPRETVLYLSFACPAIARSQGEMLAGQRGELEILAAQAQQFSVTFKDVVSLAPGVSVAWDDYARIAEKLHGLFSRADASLRDRLVAGGLLVDAAVAAAAAGTLPAFLNDTAPASFVAPARALQPEGKRQQNLMLAAFIGPVESLRRDVLASIGGSLKMVLQRGSLELKKSLRQTVDLRALAAVDAPFFTQPHEPLERFVHHARQRHAFIFPLPLRDGYRVFLLALGIARWYARAAAALAGRTTVTDDDLITGIMLAERHYLSHSTFFAALTQQSLTASFLRRMFDAPRYSATIVAE